MREDQINDSKKIKTIVESNPFIMAASLNSIALQKVMKVSCQMTLKKCKSYLK